ncbi:MAG TPA: chemotaxis protein CheW [Thermomicrobiales bacterium]|nr:chemotaxis protein CheW [Thermomicrobiales bacterium]
MAESQYVVARLGGQQYGIGISDVNQIIRAVEPTPIPGLHGEIEGIINLRGRIIPVIDLRPKLGLPMGEPTRDSRIVVVNIQGHDIGLYVDAVSEVLAIDEAVVEAPDNLVLDFDATHLRGIAKLEDRLILLLELASALDVADIAESTVLTAA